VGRNDLVTRNPGVAASWHPKKNGSLTPEMVSFASDRMVWWVCGFGHDFQTQVKTRTAGGGCGVCDGRQIHVGYNDLSTTDPVVAASWHPGKNGDWTPTQVSNRSGRQAWWVCAQGHEWRASVANRTNGRGCPRCAKHGFDQSSPSIFYFIYHRDLNSRKIGITNTHGDRLSGFLSDGWKLLFSRTSEDGQLTLAVETSVLSWIRKDLALPPHLGPQEMRSRKGWTETFSADGPSDSQIVEFIEATFADLSAGRPVA